ncbi:hypothetical protein L208DRAFT_1416789 [Tricholoma matsutake]|nr:hypothetical protein L208DRAFT_1416789 [Tricholoma matsutake 945]
MVISKRKRNKKKRNEWAWEPSSLLLASHPLYTCAVVLLNTTAAIGGWWWWWYVGLALLAPSV